MSCQPWGVAYPAQSILKLFLKTISKSSQNIAAINTLICRALPYTLNNTPTAALRYYSNSSCFNIEGWKEIKLKKKIEKKGGN